MELLQPISRIGLVVRMENKPYTRESDLEKYSGKYLTPGDALSILGGDENAIKSVEQGVNDVQEGRVRTVENPRSLKDFLDKNE